MLQVKTNSSLFDELWPYSQDALNALLRSAVHEGGGKAVGLALCEQLAQKLTSKKLNISVPTWTTLSSAAFKAMIESMDRKLIGHIIRSSAVDEDWLNGESGCHKSFPIPSFLNLLGIESNQITAKDYIKQKYQPGYGLVIDVAFSRLDGEVLVRIASGLKRFIAEDISRPYYTSATADSEASVKVFDSKKSEMLCQSECGHRDSVFSVIDNEGWNDFSLSLLNSLQSLGINFSVQLECIVDPSSPDKIFLVQLRPSPTGAFYKEAFPPLNSEIYFESGVFNRPFSTDFQKLSVIEEIHFSSYLFDSQVELSGPVAVLDPTQIESSMMRSANAAEAYTWLSNIGYKTIITPFALNPSFRHDKFEENHSGELFRKLTERCNIIFLPANVINEVVALSKDGLNEIAVQADGIIGRVYISPPLRDCQLTAHCFPTEN